MFLYPHQCHSYTAVQAARNSSPVLGHEAFTTLLRARTLTAPILQKRKLRHQESKLVVQGHMASKRPQAVWLQSTSLYPNAAHPGSNFEWLKPELCPPTTSILLDSPGRHIPPASPVETPLIQPSQPKSSKHQTLKGSLSSRDSAPDAKPWRMGCRPGTWFGSRTSQSNLQHLQTS